MPAKRGIWRLRLILVIAAAAALLGATAADKTLVLVYSGNLDGELEPCGCSAKGDFGGIRRRATVLEELRSEGSRVFVVSAGGLLSGFAVNGRLTNEYILKGFALLDYDAIGLQWNDLQYGDEFLKAPVLPWVASNWHDDGFAHERRATHGGRTVAFFSWLDPRTAPQQAMLGNHGQVVNNRAALSGALARAKRDGALTVVTTTLTLAEAQEILSLSDVDVLIIRAKYEVYGKPQWNGGTLVLQPGSRGMRIGRLDLQLDERGRIVDWQPQVIPLPKSEPAPARLQAWYAEYNVRVKDSYEQMTALRKAQAQGETPFVGAEACRGCHARAYSTWERSRHARAFGALEHVNKSFDPNCLQCHTVGFNKPGGFIDLDVTASLINVQCESCHGAARAHVASGGAAPVNNGAWQPTLMCAQCHVQTHSPAFKFDSYWPRVTHN